jgi:hypothetical protein
MNNNGTIDIVLDGTPKYVREMGDLLISRRDWIIKQIQIHNEYGEHKNTILFMDHNGDFYISPEYPSISHPYPTVEVEAENQKHLMGLKYTFAPEDDKASHSFFNRNVVEITDLMIYWS